MVGACLGSQPFGSIVPFAPASFVGSSAVTAKPDTKSSIRAKVKGFMLVSIGRTPLQSPAIVSDFVPRSEMEFTAISYGVMSHSAQRHSRRLPELQVVVCEVGISSGRSIVDWCQGAAKGSRAAGIQEFGSVNCLELKAAGPARHECLHLSLTDELAEPHNVRYHRAGSKRAEDVVGYNWRSQSHEV